MWCCGLRHSAEQRPERPRERWMNQRTRVAVQQIAPRIMAHLQTVELELQQLENAVRDSSTYDQAHCARMQERALREQVSIVHGASMGSKTND